MDRIECSQPPQPLTPFAFSYRRCWLMTSEGERRGWEVWMPAEERWRFLDEGDAGDRQLLLELGLTE